MQYMRYAKLSQDPTQSKSISRDSLHRAWQFSKKYKRQLLGYLGLISVAEVLNLAPPLIIKSLLDSAIPHRSFGQLYILIGIFFLVSVGATIVGVLQRWLSAKVGEGLIFDLRVALFQHLQRLPIAFYTKSQTGAILSRLNSDVLGSQQVITTAASSLSNVLALVLTLGVMIQLSPTVTAIALLLLPLLVVADKILGKKIAPLARSQMIANADLSSFTNERVNVSGALLVKLFGNPSREGLKFQNQAVGVRDAGIKLALGGRMYFAALGMIGTLGTISVYFMGGRLAINHALSFGTLVALAQYAARLYQPITDLASSRVNLSQSLVSFDRVAEVLNVEPTVNDPEHPLPFKNVTGRIKFSEVKFTYPKIETPFGKSDTPDLEINEEILTNINFVSEPGTMTAIVGSSGAGKSTIASLMSRLYDATSGQIYIDGIDIRDVTLQDLSEQIGVVSQESHLFHDSVKANLLYARPNATLDDLVEATSAAQIYSLIVELPDGFETIVGERGYRLSGGERQRLAIARVFLKKPSIVILDEATSHLDAENETAVQAALAKLLEKRTSIVIAHRLSTIVAADQILVIKNGRIQEVGKHKDLIAAAGVYADLFNSQMLANSPSDNWGDLTTSEQLPINQHLNP